MARWGTRLVATAAGRVASRSTVNALMQECGATPSAGAVEIYLNSIVSMMDLAERMHLQNMSISIKHLIPVLYQVY